MDDSNLEELISEELARIGVDLGKVTIKILIRIEKSSGYKNAFIESQCDEMIKFLDSLSDGELNDTFESLEDAAALWKLEGNNSGEDDDGN